MNKSLCFRYYLALTVAFLISSLLSADTQVEGQSVVHTDVEFFNEAQQRPTKVRFWYLSNGDECDAQICLSEEQDASRVAVISHGAFGTPLGMSWLAESLAARGWLVAGVAHYGESRIYGSYTIDRSTVDRFWQRPQDVSFVLDQLGDQSLFNAEIRNDQVVMLGHSLGGFTALALTGALLEAGKTEKYCQSEQASLDKGCGYVSAAKLKSLRGQVLEEIGRVQQSMSDSRIVAVIAMDPALGHAVSESSLGEIIVPTLIFGSVENDFLPYEIHAGYYAKHIGSSQLVPVGQGAGHFIYVNRCDFDGEAMGVPICTDRDGVDRVVIQEKILDRVFAFLSIRAND